MTIYTDVTVIRPLKCQNQPFVSHLLAENPGPLIPSVVAILPDFDGFLQITSKLDYLYRFSRYPTPTMPVLTLCLPPARWGPKAPDSECNGNIASFRRIASNLTKNSTIYTDLIVIRHLNAKITFVSHLLAEDPGPSIPFVVAILPDFDEFLLISSNLTIYTDVTVIRPLKCQNQPFVSHLPRWEPKALDSECSGNIARFRWISSNHVKTRLFIQI